ncbi:MAG: pyrimidine dimer DNA glycosylase/endonuclease V [Candidatus Micrarchaeales archaeon]|jgi:hypothetical protein|nr:pyrimidine dimer DNA glycosylase/endonuclease V [Candidatus Micrarchaeales archaeon]
MRIWSIKLEWLDSIGLVALWRESLLARAVLEGKTVGYVNHPQLERFKGSKNPLASIETYLYRVLEEAKRRRFGFDSEKIRYSIVDKGIKIPVSQGQLDYELEPLKFKLKNRSQEYYNRIADIKKGVPNQIFFSHPGKIESWEKVKALGG